MNKFFRFGDNYLVDWIGIFLELDVEYINVIGRTRRLS